MRRFLLARITDPAGFIAEGVAFSDGTVALRAMTGPSHTAVHASMANVLAANSGAHVRWIDPPASQPQAPKARHRA